MSILKYSFFLKTISVLFLAGMLSCGNKSSDRGSGNDSVEEEQVNHEELAGSYPYALLVTPRQPQAGQTIRVMSVGGTGLPKATVELSNSSGDIKSLKSRSGDGLPFWRIDEFKVERADIYNINLKIDGKVVKSLQFSITGKPNVQTSTAVWKSISGWDGAYEELYSAWINALFYENDERSIWKALHDVMQNPDMNFLYNHLSLGEDAPNSKNKVIMEPDCADNPFYLRAYFAWKVGLPFGFHICDRGFLGRPPQTGQWITNETTVQRPDPVQRFNVFLRMVMNGVHSGTARTSFTNESADYYPVPLIHESLRPGVMFADPYGHTLILVKRIPQTKDKPGILLSVDAQPDKTVGVKRFWKGNFLFNTSEVVGEPGFKAFRPIILEKGVPRLLKTEEINSMPGLVPFSLQQKNMAAADFYHIMDLIINPRPMDPEMALLDLVNALFEQLNVRITSVSNGEAYMKAHPAELVPMPGTSAGVFQAGGQWEDFSTPNRDLRLLIAMDAVLDFPDKVYRSPKEFKIPLLSSPESVKKNLGTLLDRKLSELSITYTRSNGKEQTLTLKEILNRREAFEMAYNPNDGIEIRWGAAEGSEERSSCKRQVSASQLQKMKETRKWFIKRLHPPT